jgi:hypothetical protein
MLPRSSLPAARFCRPPACPPVDPDRAHKPRRKEFKLIMRVIAVRLGLLWFNLHHHNVGTPPIIAPCTCGDIKLSVVDVKIDNSFREV